MPPPLLDAAATGSLVQPRTLNNNAIVRIRASIYLRPILGKIRKNCVRNANIKEQYNIQDIVKWGLVRIRNWNECISRMNSDRMVKTVRDNKPQESRLSERSLKR
ncbi:hypothetical protein M0802_010393 [Mischocyttarus mexicanus]|nr:hypothetical protein M0802_010393 [Mischocyttarus mexicanus]